MGVLQFKKANCKNCYKCVRNCPVKAIRVIDQQAQIVEEDCILCGRCTVVCPQNAKEDIGCLSEVRQLIAQGREVVAAVAPSFTAYFNGCDWQVFASVMKQLGFSQVFETAEGAFLVKSEYERLLQSCTEGPVISTCCSTVNQYVQKYLPAAIPFMAPVVTPLRAVTRLIRQRCPGATVVFLSPCISKKTETISMGCGDGPDFDLTFDELDDWLRENNIALGRSKINSPAKLSRMFPVTGGVIRTMIKEPGWRYLAVDGMEDCIAALQDAVDGKLKHCFIELSACEGGCVGGPAFLKRDKRIAVSVADVQDSALDGTEDDFEVSEDITMESTMRSTPVYRPEPSAEQLEKILQRMGKKNLEDELNCGICGYPTCREKAKAVFLGRADIDMCLPYMKEKAESYSDKIVGVSPNAIVTVGRDLRVKQINQAACDIFAIRKREDIIGYPVSRILDEFDFVRMLSGDGRQTTNYTYLSDYNVYLEQVFLCDEDREIVTCIMKDVTQSRQKKNHIRQVKLRTASMADEIVEKQMRIAHEIASLLGETVAETKVAVNDLKNTILMDEDKDEQR